MTLIHRTHIIIATLAAVALAAGCGSEEGTTGAGTGGGGWELEPDLGAGEEENEGDSGAPLEPGDMAETPPPPGEVDTSPLGTEDRPAEVLVPPRFANDREVALLVFLHGYSDSKARARLWEIDEAAAREDVILVLPQGTRDSFGQRFWHANDTCCDNFDAGVDDVAYLRGVIDEALERYTIDPGRVYVFGHSNGGFMAYQLACELGDRVAAIASLAGSTPPADGHRCEPGRPVGVVQLHGTSDLTVGYYGGRLPVINTPFLGAEEVTARFAAINGCEDRRDGTEGLDLTSVWGDETEVSRYMGCPEDGPVTLMTMVGEGHIPNFHDVGARVLRELQRVDRTP